MMYLKPLINKILLDKDLINQAKKCKNDEELFSFLANSTSIDEIKNAFSHYYGIKYVNLNLNKINISLLDNFDINLLQKELILPYHFDEKNNVWHFAISNLIDKSIEQNICKILSQKNQPVSFTFSFEHELKSIFNQLNKLEITETEENKNVEFNATEWVTSIIDKGIVLKASDIHIERLEKGLKVRYRIDGTISHAQTYDFNLNEISNIYVRLKIISNMDIVEKRRSQDGRIDKYKYNNLFYDIRVSSINTVLGEKFVMRIFSKENKTLSFKELGFTDNQENQVMKMIRKNNGIIYLAGGTGAGKTTTLYTMIGQLDKKTLNIYTVENPVEKGIINVNQIQVDEASGVTYPSVLKTLLRQDPDIIVIGEIREAETAELAVRASLTGHLVMTTVHANNALDSISRLSDMGIESYLIGASSVGFLSQRLVKLLCPHCKQKLETLSDSQRTWIEEDMPNFDYEYYKSQGKFIYKAKGCNHCNNGYSGRIAVIEIIYADDKIKSLISKQASQEDIKKYLNDIGYITMKKDGINKALEGLTSIKELIGQLQ